MVLTRKILTDRISLSFCAAQNFTLLYQKALNSV